MPITINPIKKEIIKTELLKGNSARQALRKAKYSEGHIRRSTKNRIVKDSIAEILAEMDEKGLVDKSYRTLDKNLSAPKPSDQIASAQAILKFKVGEKRRVITDEDKSILRKYLPDIEI